jgi:hypothetical protein
MAKARKFLPMKDRCYNRDLCKGVSIQIYDRWSPPDEVKVEIYLRPDVVRKYRKLVDALFKWAKGTHEASLHRQNRNQALTSPATSRLLAE